MARALTRREVERMREQWPEECCGRCEYYDEEQSRCKLSPALGYLMAGVDVCNRFCRRADGGGEA